MFRLLRLTPRRPDKAAHGYFYYRFTKRYMALVRYFLDRPRLLPRVRDSAGHRLARTHHAKVVPAQQARRILTIDHPIEWRDLEHVVPFQVARDVVLEVPLTIAVAECACRAVARGLGARPRERTEPPDHACGPIEQCLYIGDPIATYMVEHQPTKARFVAVDEALAVVAAAAARGAVHTLWFKDAAGGRMYSLCNCCRCCCIGLKAHGDGYRAVVGSGYVAVVDPARCSGCGRCVSSCAFVALALERSSDAADGGHRLLLDEAGCHGCGVCTQVCDEGALRLQSSRGGVSPLPL